MESNDAELVLGVPGGLLGAMNTSSARMARCVLIEFPKHGCARVELKVLRIVAFSLWDSGFVDGYLAVWVIA